MVRRFVFLWFFTAFLVDANPMDLLYFTDAHRIYPVDDVDGGRGGVARLKTVADEFRSENSEVMLIHGGDLCGGVLFGGIYKGKPMVEAFNAIPVDLSNFGQHEFDFGAAHALSLVKASQFEWLTTNLKTKDGKSFGGLPVFIRKKMAGMDVVFLGLTDAMDTTMVDKDVTQKDLFEAVRAVLPRVNPWDFLVVLTQTDLQTNRKLLDQFPEIDLILTEEQYEYESNVYYVGSRAIVAPAGNMSSVAHIRVNCDKKLSLSMIPLDTTVQADPKLQEIELQYVKSINDLLSEEVGEVEIDLDARSAHTGENSVGNLVADAFRYWHHSDVGLINSGSLRADLPAGKLTLKSIRSLLPFGNHVCKFSILGKDLKQLLKERTKSGKSGQLLHVSGIRYEYLRLSDRIEVFYDEKPLDDRARLSVATSDYLLEKIKVPIEVLVARGSPSAIEDFNAFADYCRIRKHLSPRKEGRILIAE